MSRTYRILSLVVVASLLVLATPLYASSAGAPSRCIVVFEGGAVNQAAMAKMERLGAVKVKELPMTGGAVVYLPNPAAERAAAAVPGVAWVEVDVRVSASARPAKPGKPGDAPTQPAEVLPWGVDRIEADLVWGATPGVTGDAVKVAVIDTGVDVSHPDLAGNIAGGINTISPNKSYKDDNGHGTHVAGTIAAIDNEIGVVGVAPAADIYGVKALNRNGSGWLSDIVEGINWSAESGMDVINMSLGTPYYSLALDVAVQDALSAGVVVVAAAGNSGPYPDTVEYPGALNGVIAVAAVNSSDKVASFSSRGEEVDLAAPGVSVLSTYKGSTYAYMSGTSMASPHVAGAAALLLAADGTLTPAQVTARLAETAIDLGAAGQDDSYGWGLVQVDDAIGQ